jgi:hypothetical protein
VSVLGVITLAILVVDDHRLDNARHARPPVPLGSETAD